MRVILQRVKHAKCLVNNVITGEIEQGYLLLVGFTHHDNLEKINKMAKKIANLRIFEDENGKMNLSILEVRGKILSISQFTLYANLASGNRPSFTESLNPVEAKKLYHDFNQTLRTYGLTVEEGVFGEHMELDFVNNGPVTINLEF